MLARYKEVVDAVLNFRDAWNDSKDHLLRRAALGLMPRLAAFAPERFASSYLNTCTHFLLAALRCVHAVPCLMVRGPRGCRHACRAHLSCYENCCRWFMSCQEGREVGKAALVPQCQSRYHLKLA